MSTVKVRLKDASGNVLHPETDWSIVQNKPSSYPTTWSEVNGRPSIEAPDDIPEETWSAPNKSIEITGKKCGICLDSAKGIIIYDECQGVNSAKPLTEYPINYTKLAGRPTSMGYSGVYKATTSNNTEKTDTVYPAVRISKTVTKLASGQVTSSDEYYYFDGTGWKTMPSNKLEDLLG